MQIECLRVKNFRCFEDREFRFNSRFNLLIGDNAAGKSTVFEALAIAVGSWLLGVRGYGKTPVILPDAVRYSSYRYSDSVTFEKQFPSRVEAAGLVLNEHLTWARELLREGGHTTTVNARAISELASEAVRKVRTGEHVTLPLICAYGTERLWFEKRRSSHATRLLPSRLDGYRDCFDFSIQETELIAWIGDQQTVQPETAALGIVRNAIRNCVTGARSLTYDGRYKDLVVDINPSGPQFFKTLSDGQRIMLTLIGDLARRVATLNPHLGTGALSEASGVVLIDELDLHLHPKWQRHIIHDLKNTFPLVQFVATTHSPQLIGEALPEEIIMLGVGNSSTPLRSFGIDSRRILEEVEDKLGSDDPEVTRARTLMAFLQSTE